jgi:hypothetical protein
MWKEMSVPKGVPADLVGQRFGLWNVLRKADDYPYGSVRWVCVCVCGITTDVPTGNLVSGKSKGCRSCGAYRGHDKRRARAKS